MNYIWKRKLDEQLKLDIYLFVSNLVVMKLYPANALALMAMMMMNLKTNDAALKAAVPTWTEFLKVLPVQTFFIW